MSIIDPLRFFAMAIVICAVLQVCGVFQGPYSVPDGAWSDDEKFDAWYKETFNN